MAPSAGRIRPTGPARGSLLHLYFIKQTISSRIYVRELGHRLCRCYLYGLGTHNPTMLKPLNQLHTKVLHRHLSCAVSCGIMGYPGIPEFFQNIDPGILKNLIPGFFRISRSPCYTTAFSGFQPLSLTITSCFETFNHWRST